MVAVGENIDFCLRAVRFSSLSSLFVFCLDSLLSLPLSFLLSLFFSPFPSLSLSVSWVRFLFFFAFVTLSLFYVSFDTRVSEGGSGGGSADGIFTDFPLDSGH